MLFLLFLCLYHCDERRNCIYEHLWIYVDILSVLNRIKSGVSEVKSNRQISRRMDTHGIIVVERFATFHYY